MQKTVDSSSESQYKFINTHSSSKTGKGVVNLYKDKLRRQGFASYEIDYMEKNGFKKLRTSKRHPYPFH